MKGIYVPPWGVSIWGRLASPLYCFARGKFRNPLLVEISTLAPGIQSNEAFLTTSYVDLRSDTVTRPTPAMRHAMAEAEVGDDVFHDDPTVRLLEEETAAVLGKEASLFVPSGCMGNEVSVSIQTKRGDAILLHRDSHLVLTEAAAITELLGRKYHRIDGDRGRMRPEEVSATLAASAAGPGTIAMVEVENTVNWGNGSIYPLPQLEAIGKAAHGRGLPVHLDGARLWNASAATPGLRLDPREIETNIVIAQIEEPHDRIHAFVAAVESEGVRLTPFGGPGRFRAVTHMDVDDAGIERAVAAIRRAAASVLKARP